MSALRIVLSNITMEKILSKSGIIHNSERKGRCSQSEDGILEFARIKAVDLGREQWSKWQYSFQLQKSIIHSTEK